LDGVPTWERERRWAVLGLLVLVLLMGAGALGLALSGFAWV
jgi:hypothetical protein